MRKLNKQMTDDHAVKVMVHNAKQGTWDGKGNTQYFEDCRNYFEKYEAMIIFTRDTGHHSGGWWKNPDFERCFHLSISFVDPYGNRKPHNKKKADRIVKMFFGHNVNNVWCEPPYSDEGITGDVWHYRLFCDPAWKAIKPRGEVYSTEFTEAGWKSFSELNKL